MRTDEPRPNFKPIPLHAWAVTLLAAIFCGPSASAQTAPLQDKKTTEDLSKRLLEQDESAEENPMEQILKMMDETRQRLHRQYDPGAQTQNLQREITKRLDEVIEIALRNRSSGGGSSSASSDERQKPDAPPEKKRPTDTAKSGDEPQDTDPGADVDAPTKPHSEAFKETRRGWGHLPPRDRDEIIQGIGEEVLDGYRVLVERYYQALAEAEDGAGEEEPEQ